MDHRDVLPKDIVLHYHLVISLTSWYYSAL